MKKFEYKIQGGSVDTVIERDEALLQQLGEEGWELLFMLEGKARGEGFGAKRMYYYFKKEVLS